MRKYLSCQRARLPLRLEYCTSDCELPLNVRTAAVVSLAEAAIPRSYYSWQFSFLWQPCETTTTLSSPRIFYTDGAVVHQGTTL